MSFSVHATGSDPSPGPGIVPSGNVFYDLYVKIDSGAFTYWATVPAINPSATYNASSNHSYAFYSIAHDAAGNVEIKSPVIEASTYVPDLTPPDSHVTSVASATPTFAVNWSGSDSGGSGLAFFDVYVQVDGAAAQQLGHFAAATPDANGVSTGSISYQAKSDGVSHTYRFYSISIDRNQNTEAAPSDPAGDVVITATFAPPASLQIATLDVQHGAVGRSYIRYVDLVFNQSTGLDVLITSNRIKLTRFELDGTGGQAISLGGVLSTSGSNISFNFGAAGIGGNANSTAADGYYEIALDLDGSGQFATKRHFYRLLGDVNGDRVVDDNDVARITAALGQSGSGLDTDVNGDGFVTSADRTLAMRSRGRRLGAGLLLG